MGPFGNGRPFFLSRPFFVASGAGCPQHHGMFDNSRCSALITSLLIATDIPAATSSAGG